MLMRVVRWVAGIAILMLLLPVASPFIAGAIAASHDCRLDEGSIHPCTVMGMEMGDTLYTLFVLGWFAIASLPLAGMVITAWLVIEAVVALARRRRT